jgi:glycosyltransferase involved in cell wall biosynthesis
VLSSKVLAREDADFSISVFIMTYNEEVNIERCLDSVCWSNDVVILDSFSQDRTVKLASVYPNVRIFHREFDGFSSQRNYGIHQIRYFNRWLLVLDADEVVEPALASEILAIARQQSIVPYDVFLLRRKIFMGDRWIRWNVSFGFWIPRLICPLSVHYEGAVHEKVCFAGAYGRLMGALEHHQFSKGTENWLVRRLQYAKIESELDSEYKTKLSLLRGIISTHTLHRRSALKALFYRLPARWFFYFIYNLVFKFPYLDGLPGLRYLFLETYSHYLAVSITKESKNAQSHQTHSTSTL